MKLKGRWHSVVVDHVVERINQVKCTFHHAAASPPPAATPPSQNVGHTAKKGTQFNESIY